MTRNVAKEYVILPENNNKLLDLAELWMYRELLFFFTWRDIKVKYKQTTLGVLWALLQPVFLVLIFTVFFAGALKAPATSLEYPVFAFSGLILWNLFSTGLTNAGNSMITNAQIIKKVYFPRLVIPFSAVISSAFDFLMGFIVFSAMLIFYRVEIDWLALIYCWPLALMLAVLGTLGPGFLLSALSVKYRDFRYVIPFVIQALFFLTPVVYSVTIVRQTWIHYLLALNPMYGAISLFRQPLESGTGYDVPYANMLSIISTILFFMVGLLYFKRTERYFADLA
jgi:lipopolysaccharide transport system permease protein